jgi:hypothetical protein
VLFVVGCTTTVMVTAFAYGVVQAFRPDVFASLNATAEPSSPFLVPPITSTGFAETAVRRVCINPTDSIAGAFMEYGDLFVAPMVAVWCVILLSWIASAIRALYDRMSKCTASRAMPADVMPPGHPEKGREKDCRGRLYVTLCREIGVAVNKAVLHIQSTAGGVLATFQDAKFLDPPEEKFSFFFMLNTTWAWYVMIGYLMSAPSGDRLDGVVDLCMVTNIMMIPVYKPFAVPMFYCIGRAASASSRLSNGATRPAILAFLTMAVLVPLYLWVSVTFFLLALTGPIFLAMAVINGNGDCAAFQRTHPRYRDWGPSNFDPHFYRHFFRCLQFPMCVHAGICLVPGRQFAT